MDTPRHLRTLLGTVLVVGVTARFAPLARAWPAAGATRTVRLDQTVDYVLSCRKPNGAFGPKGQEYTDAAWTYPAVHTLRLLGTPILDANAVRQYGLGYPSGHAGVGHWLVFHQAITRWLLTDAGGRPAAALGPNDGRSPVTLRFQGFEVRYYGSPFGTGGELFFQVDGESTAERFRSADEMGYYNLSSLHYLIAAILADGRTVANPRPLVEFIHQRQAANGGFVDVRHPNATADDEETHVAHTFHAVSALSLLNAPIPRRERCARFVRSCQVQSVGDRAEDATERLIGAGGFRFSPDATQPGNYADVYYTYCGLQVLELLGVRPAATEPCLDWLASLQNHDGGFGDRPGWRSRLYSTYYAVHSLKMLGRLRTSTSRRADEKQTAIGRLLGRPFSRDLRTMLKPRRVAVPQPDSIDGDGLRVYQGLNKTPLVEPSDLAGLHRRGLNLLALKTGEFTQAEPLLRSLRRIRRPMDVVLCPEAYPHRLVRHGSVELHHVGNFTLDPRWDRHQRGVWRTADSEGQKRLAWPAYQRRVLRPLQELGSLCYPEQDFELELAYSAYDDGVYGRGGYNAVQAGFNWSPRDFVRVFPWRERYVDKLVPVADADAHGDLQKWSPQLDHTRHLYIARGPTYADFLDAARNRRVVCVVYGVEGVPSGASYYGSPAAVRFVKQRVDEWKWW